MTGWLWISVLVCRYVQEQITQKYLLHFEKNNKESRKVKKSQEKEKKIEQVRSRIYDIMHKQKKSGKIGKI